MDSFFKCADIAGEVYKNNMPGIKHSRKKYKGIVIDDMKISNDNNPYHKKAGRYVLIDPISPIFEDDYALMDVLTKYLKLLVKNKTKRKSKLNVLIVGLGNKDYTPDSLGPKVIDKVDVNYHLKNREASESAPCTITLMDSGILAEIPDYDKTLNYEWDSFTTIYKKFGYYMLFENSKMTVMLREADIPENQRNAASDFIKSHVDMNKCKVLF